MMDSDDERLEIVEDEAEIHSGDGPAGQPTDGGWGLRSGAGGRWMGRTCRQTAPTGGGQAEPVLSAAADPAPAPPPAEAAAEDPAEALGETETPAPAPTSAPPGSEKWSAVRVIGVLEGLEPSPDLSASDGSVSGCDMDLAGASELEEGELEDDDDKEEKQDQTEHAATESVQNGSAAEASQGSPSAAEREATKDAEERGAEKTEDEMHGSEQVGREVIDVKKHGSEEQHCRSECHRQSPGRKRHWSGEEASDDNCVYVRGASPRHHPVTYETFFDWPYDMYEGFTSPAGKRRRPDKKRKPSAICAYYMQGKCLKGKHCTFSHKMRPPRKMELCKFYARECCVKQASCLYLHKGFPCKIFHTGARCFSAAKCKFSHDPMTDVTKSILIKHLETAPADILGEFPRMGRQGAIHMIQLAKMRRKRGEPPNFSFPNIEHTRYTHLVKEQTEAAGWAAGRGRPERRARSATGGGRRSRTLSHQPRGHDSDRRLRRRHSRERRRRRRTERCSRTETTEVVPAAETGSAKAAAAAASSEDIGHLPAGQRLLYRRIQQQQKDIVPRECTPQPTDDDEPLADDNWYSSDEENAQPLTAVLQRISAQPADVCGEPVDDVSRDVMDPMDAISQLLRKIRGGVSDETWRAAGPSQPAAADNTDVDQQRSDFGPTVGSQGGDLRSHDWPRGGGANRCDDVHSGDLTSHAVSDMGEVGSHDDSGVGDLRPRDGTGIGDLGSNDHTATGALGCHNGAGGGEPAPHVPSGQPGWRDGSRAGGGWPAGPVDWFCPPEAQSTPPDCQPTHQRVDSEAPPADTDLRLPDRDERGAGGPPTAAQWSDGVHLALPFTPVHLTPCVEIDASVAARTPMRWVLTAVAGGPPDYALLRLRLGEAGCRDDPRLRTRRRRGPASEHGGHGHRSPQPQHQPQQQPQQPQPQQPQPQQPQQQQPQQPQQQQQQQQYDPRQHGTTHPQPQQDPRHQGTTRSQPQAGPDSQHQNWQDPQHQNWQDPQHQDRPDPRHFGARDPRQMSGSSEPHRWQNRQQVEVECRSPQPLDSQYMPAGQLHDPRHTPGGQLLDPRYEHEGQLQDPHHMLGEQSENPSHMLGAQMQSSQYAPEGQMQSSQYVLGAHLQSQNYSPRGQLTGSQYMHGEIRKEPRQRLEMQPQTAQFPQQNVQPSGQTEQESGRPPCQPNPSQKLVVDHCRRPQCGLQGVRDVRASACAGPAGVRAGHHRPYVSLATAGLAPMLLAPPPRPLLPRPPLLARPPSLLGLMPTSAGRQRGGSAAPALRHSRVTLGRQ